MTARMNRYMLIDAQIQASVYFLPFLKRFQFVILGARNRDIIRAVYQ